MWEGAGSRCRVSPPQLQSVVVVVAGSLTLLSQEVEAGRSVGGCREQAQGIATSLWITCECIGSFFGSFAGGFSYDR